MLRTKSYELGMCSSIRPLYARRVQFHKNYGRESGNPRILSLSLEDKTFKVIAEVEYLNETENQRVNQVDEEFFYHGEQIYTLP